MGEFTYAYLLHDEGLFRINMSDFGGFLQKKELKVECVYFDPSSLSGSRPFKAMGLFSNRHTLYMIGGDSAETGQYPDGSSFYSFNPTRFNEFPVKDTECVDEPDFYGDFGALKCPHVVRANRMIYFFPNRVAPFYFRSFDFSENRFYTPPPPPFVLENRTRVSEVSGAFVLRGYLYLFLEESSDVEGSCVRRAFSFNTRLLKWREEEAMVLQFKEKDIPLPYDHRGGGGIGLSNEFADNTHVLVALSGRKPTAYRVCLHPKGSFTPKSYRHPCEVYIDPPYGGSGKLFDLGSGRFCWIFYSLFEAFVVCVFKIDFAHEHEIQISSIDEGSAKIISSKIFYENDIPFSRNYDFNDVCLGSAPALHSYVLSVPSDEYLSAAWSEEHEVTASPSNEGQDRDAEIEKRNTTSSCKRDGGGNDARGPEDMGAEEECEQIEDSVGEKQVRSLSRLGSRLSEKKGKDCEASTKQDERSCCRGGNDARGPEDMGVEEGCDQIECSVGEKQVKSLSRLGSMLSENKGKDCEASTKQDERSCCRGGNDARGPEDMGVEEECEQIEGSVGDASSEQRIIQEAENTAAEAKVKVLELQLEASNKANSAVQARLEALEQEKIKLSEKVEAQRKQLKAKDEELASTQDKAIQECRQSEEFRQAAQSYARENISRILSDKVAQNHIFKALFKTAYEEDEGQAPRPSAMEEGFGRQEHEVTSAPNCEDQDRDGQMEKRNKINSDKKEMGGNNAKKRRCRSRD